MNVLGAHGKKAINIENLKARHDLLLSSLAATNKVSKIVASSIVGQRSFAALSIPKMNIAPLSLNTIKSLANKVYAHHEVEYGSGYAYLDSLRLRLKICLEVDRLEVGDRSQESKSKRQKDRIEALEKKLASVEAQSIIRSKAYCDLFGRINLILKGNCIEEGVKFRLLNILDQHKSLFSAFLDVPMCVASAEESVFTIIPGGKNN